MFTLNPVKTYSLNWTSLEDVSFYKKLYLGQMQLIVPQIPVFHLRKHGKLNEYFRLDTKLQTAYAK